MKLGRDDDGGASTPERINQNDNMQSQLGSNRIPDFWSKQYQVQQQQQQRQQQQQQQQQQMLYSYPMTNGAMQQPQQQQQQQQILNVPLTMPYASPGNPQQQQFIYMQQQNTSISTGYAFDPNNSRLSGDGDGRYQSQPYNRQQQQQQQQQQYQSNGPSRQRNGWPSTVGRGDKNRHNGSSHDQDDMYSPLDSNGEMSSRSNGAGQRPTEGEGLAVLYVILVYSILLYSFLIFSYITVRNILSFTLLSLFHIVSIPLAE